MHRNLRESRAARSGRTRRVHPATPAVTAGDSSFAFSRCLDTARCAPDRRLHSIEGHASAQCTVHRLADLGVTWVRVPVEQCLCRHDLAVLAISALRGLLLDPRLLERMQPPILRETLECRHLATHG